MSLWFRTEDLAKTEQTLFNSDPHNGLIVSFNYRGTRRLGMVLGDGIFPWKTPVVTYSATQFAESRWVMVTLVKDGDRFKLYADGRIEASITTPTQGWNKELSAWMGSMGAIWPYEVFAGLIDDVRI